jgi:NAD+ synthase (glutamine-hydrolysing)
MKAALIQQNPTVGAIVANSALVTTAVSDARAAGADLAIFSELFVSGYPPKDLLRREGFVAACDRAVLKLAQALPCDVGVLIGHPTERGLPAGRIANACSLLCGGEVVATVQKLLLPNYDVFDERRYFRPADDVAPVPFRGRKLGVHICEDAWWGEPSTFYRTDPEAFPDPVARLAEQGADILINVSASPFEVGKPARRRELLRRHVVRHHRPLLFVNQIGGNDDLVFDGNSIVLNESAELVAELAGFRTDFRLIDLDRLPPPCEIPAEVPAAELFDALVLGLRDYMRKSGFTDCVLGLSGGIDSALAACIAAEAVGADRVHGLMMPSRYSSQHSVDDARQLAENLGMGAEVIAIDAVHRAYETLAVVGDELRSAPAGIADQNLQARIRGALVMIRSNHHGWLPLATGNKSELAMGYCTLYGDMAGGFAVLADVLKRDVYAVSRHINAAHGREIIPQHVIDKPPSAELAPDQFDQDTLPSYPLLDAILEGLVEEEASVETLSRRYPEETVRWVARRLDRNEYKRRQIPPGIKISERAFGSGRRMPMAARDESAE